MVGDVIMVERGMRIPADCVVISGEAKVRQMFLNGQDAENLAVVSLQTALAEPGENRQPFIMANTYALESSKDCKAIVCAVGKQTQFGMLGRTELFKTIGIGYL